MENGKNKASGRAKSKVRAFRIQEMAEKPIEVVSEYAIRLEDELELEQKENELLRKEVERLQVLLNQREKKTPLDRYADYDKSANGILKIHFILQRNKKSMSLREIRDVLLQLEPELRERWGNVEKSVANLIFKAHKYGVISRSQIYPGRGSFVYTIPRTLPT